MRRAVRTSYAPGHTNGSGPFSNARKREPIEREAGRASAADRACGSGLAPAIGSAVAIIPDAANPAICTNSRRFVFLAICAPLRRRPAQISLSLPHVVSVAALDCQVLLLKAHHRCAVKALHNSAIALAGFATSCRW